MLCCCSVTKSCPILCYPMDSSMPGFPVRHHLPKFSQTHTHWVNDAIQPSHPLSSSSPAFNLSQHQGLLQWVNSSHQVVKLLEFQLHSINIQGLFLSGLIYLISMQSKGISSLLQHYSSQGSIFLALSLHYGSTLTSIHDYWKNHSFD